MIVVVDDEDRENEGDLTLAAEKVTPRLSTSWPSLAAAWSAAMTEERLEHLNIGPMTSENLRSSAPHFAKLSTRARE